MKIRLPICFLCFQLLLNTMSYAELPQEPKSVLKAQKQLVYRMNIYDKPPTFGKGIRLAIYQSRDEVGSLQAMDANFQRLIKAVKHAKKFDAQVISFPELYLTGYALSPKMGQNLAVYKTSPFIKKAQDIAKKYNIAIILPYAEKAKDDKGKMRYYDSIAFIDNQGKLLESYKKTHLFALAERLNWSAGNGPYKVFKVNGFPIGILNCYEAEFPELQRILALKGAKLIVIPTAADKYYTKPDGQRTKVPYPDVSTLLIPAAAYANNIFIAYSNHVGFEHIGKNKWHYQGNSVIATPTGQLLLKAHHSQSTLLIADILPSAYGPTHPENANYLKDRRPRLYQELRKNKVEFDGGYYYEAYPKGEYDYPGYQKIMEEKDKKP
jgi:predicted amidohydrolase